MSQSIFITGCSSGIGKAAAIYFAQQGWQVAATMRSPEKETELQQHKRIHLFQLDVTDEASIEAAREAALKQLGTIDVVVNNAGYGTAGPFEAATQAQIKRQFDTNLFGLFDVTRAFIPHFREQKSGVFINISSIGGLVTFPTFSLYHASKWAVEGFSESLAFELGPFGIRIKIVEPGGVITDFGTRSLDILQEENVSAHYADTLEKVSAVFQDPERRKGYSSAEHIAEIIYQAAKDDSDQLRYVAGQDAIGMWETRKQMGDEAFRNMIRQNMLS